jgi:hypothetical protein
MLGARALSWSIITQRGVVVEKPQVGAGQATTRVFDEGLNPSKAEGLHLRIRDIMLRRPVRARWRLTGEPLQLNLRLGWGRRSQ